MDTKIKELYELGFSIKKISYDLNIENNYVKNFVKDNNLVIEKQVFDETKIDHIIDLYSRGVSAKNLGIAYSIGKYKILKWADDRNIMRSRNEAHRITFFNEQVFDNIDTKEKAYWLGFFYADAYNCYKTNTVSISLAEIDLNHLEKLSVFLGLPKEKIKTHTHKINDKTYISKSVKIYSKHICDTLKEKGCPQAKSFIIKFPLFLSKNLYIDFIRGLFDGDGSLCRRNVSNEWKISLVSTKECLEVIKNIFIELLNITCYINYISKTNNNTYELIINGNEQVYKTANLLYNTSNNNTRLNRKYEKYLELQIQQQNRHFSKEKYKLSKNTVDQINNELNDGYSLNFIADKYNIHPRTVSSINKKNIDLICKKLNLPNTKLYNKVFIINNQKMSADFFKSLSKEERKQWVQPIFDYIRNNEFVLLDDFNKVLRCYDNLLKYTPDISINEIGNNVSVATYISKYFCKEFFQTKSSKNITLFDVINNDDLLIKAIENRLVINWNSKTNETFNISFGSLIQGMRSSMMISQVSIFKPTVAKYMCEKYSSIGDLVGDYSCGFGARMLGAISSGRRYIGTDPLTINSLNKMAEALEFDKNDYTLINSGSEFYKYEENTLDLCYSSPPYYDQEVYSDDNSQSYNRGKDYFYNEYWKKTLQNVKIGLKPSKYFGLNITDKYEYMIKMAVEQFGEPIEIVKLKTIRSHLSSSAGLIKYEPIYIFQKK